MLGHFGAQPFGRLSDGKREGRVLLNLTQMFHRVAAPSWDRQTRQPVRGGAGHGPSSTDPRLAFIGILPGRFGCGEFLFNERRWLYQVDSLSWALT